jgi:peptidoglycan/LPS O-acetylase OafA/YrhL
VAVLTDDLPVDPDGNQFVDAGGTAPEDRAFRPDIEGLRAVAVLLVVFFHAGAFHLVGGFVGVDVFFVISGFVITGVLLRQSTSMGRPNLVLFYSRRVLRIIPMATVVISTVIIVERVMFGAKWALAVASGARWATLFCSNIHPSFLLATFWSLGVEEQFYLVYPILFVLIATLCRQWSLRAKLGGALSLIVAVSFSWMVLHPSAAYSSVTGRAWELATGALVAVVTGKLTRLPKPMATGMTWIGLASLLLVAFSHRLTAPYAAACNAMVVGGTALIIAGGTATPRAGTECLLRLAPFKWLGRWSYSLYLWHWPVIVIAIQYWGHSTAGIKLAAVGFAVVLSAITYFGIENPIRHSKFLSRSPLTGLVFGALLILASLVAITIVS